MQNRRDKYFKGQQDDEIFICFVRHHWIYLLKDLLQMIALIIVSACFVFFARDIQNFIRGNMEIKLFFLTGFLLYTIWLHRLFIHFLNFFINIGIITNLRFIDHQKSLFFKDTIDSIDMAQIQNIEQVEDGVLPNLLGFGQIKIYLNASFGVKTYTMIPNIKFHFRCLSRQKEARQQELYMNERKQAGVEPPVNFPQTTPIVEAFLRE